MSKVHFGTNHGAHAGMPPNVNDGAQAYINGIYAQSLGHGGALDTYGGHGPKGHGKGGKTKLIAAFAAGAAAVILWRRGLGANATKMFNDALPQVQKYFTQAREGFMQFIGQNTGRAAGKTTAKATAKAGTKTAAKGTASRSTSKTTSTVRKGTPTRATGRPAPRTGGSTSGSTGSK